NKYGVQEYIINRAKKDYYRDLQNANIRMLDLRGGELFILFNGRKKWLK
ncbi:structural protein, partial [Flavobacterium phage vB_FspP_elemoA_13-9B]